MSSGGRRRQRRAVIPEEQYTSTLEQIIQRDYFPIGDTAPHGQQQQQRTVAEFHAAVTSEDNAEFERNQQKELQLYREKLRDMFQPKSSSQLLLENGEPEETPSKQKHILSNNGLFGVPSPLTICGDASVATARTRTQPKLLYSGSQAGDAPSTTTATSVASITKQELEKKIVPSQTRFSSSAMVNRPNNNTTALAAHLGRFGTKRRSNSMSSHSTHSNATTDIDSESLQTFTRARQAHRQREQQTLVNVTPLVQPHSFMGGEEQQQPVFRIITLGMVAGPPVPVPSVASYNEPTMEKGHQQAVVPPTAATIPSNTTADMTVPEAVVVGNPPSNNLMLPPPSKRRRHKDRDDGSTIHSGRSSRSGRSRSSRSSKRGQLSSFSPAAVSLLQRTSNHSGKSSAGGKGIFASRASASPFVRPNSNASTKSSRK